MRESSNTRKMQVEQGDMICQRSKNYFFPNGKSKKGKLEDFTFDILSRGCSIRYRCDNGIISFLAQNSNVKILSLHKGT